MHQLATRLSSAREWSVEVPEPPPRRGGGAARASYTLEQLGMGQAYVVSLRARNALGWGNASSAGLLVSTTRRSEPAILALALGGLLCWGSLGLAVLLTARPRWHRWKRLTLPRWSRRHAGQNGASPSPNRAPEPADALRLLVRSQQTDAGPGSPSGLAHARVSDWR